MTKTIKHIILKDGGRYYIIVPWQEITQKPELITQSKLNAKNYLTKAEIEKLVNKTLNSIPAYNGESEEI